MRIQVNILSILLILITSTIVYGQAPLGINYQGVARSADGSPIVSRTVGLRISITNGANGSSDYTEEHSVETNEFGLFAIIIGNGQSSGNINDVDWVLGNKWVQVELDTQDQGNYILVGTQQLMSVPYALFSAQSGSDLASGVGIDISNGQVSNTLPDQIIGLNGSGATIVTGTYPNFTIESTDDVDDADADPANEIQTLSLAANSLDLTNSTSVDLTGYLDNTDSQNLTQTASGTNRTIEISGGTGTTIDVADNDNDSINEIQTLSLTTNSLDLTNSTSVDLSVYLDNTDSQNLTDVLNQDTDAGTNQIKNLGDPTDAQDATTKGYVDLNTVNLSTDISTNSTAISDEATARTNADTGIQAELDGTQTGAGLNNDGTYTPDASTVFLSTATDLMDADSKLDSQIQSNSSDISTLTTRLDNTYAFHATFSINNSGPTVEGQVSLTETVDDFNQIASNTITIGADGLYLISVDAERASSDPSFNSLFLEIKGSNSNVPGYPNLLNFSKTIILSLNNGDIVRLLSTNVAAMSEPVDGIIGGYKISD